MIKRRAVTAAAVLFLFQYEYLKYHTCRKDDRQHDGDGERHIVTEFESGIHVPEE
jgi:hypothetical protein